MAQHHHPVHLQVPLASLSNLCLLRSRKSHHHQTEVQSHTLAGVVIARNWQRQNPKLVEHLHFELVWQLSTVCIILMRNLDVLILSC